MRTMSLVWANVNLPAVEFSRVCSNLMNNAIEALDDTSSILVSVEMAGPKDHIVISDTGAGMTPDVLQQVRSGAFTSGKPRGNGIGIARARQALASIGAQLDIASSRGSGTVVTLTFDKVATAHD